MLYWYISPMFQYQVTCSHQSGTKALDEHNKTSSIPGIERRTTSLSSAFDLVIESASCYLVINKNSINDKLVFL